MPQNLRFFNLPAFGFMIYFCGDWPLKILFVLAFVETVPLLDAVLATHAVLIVHPHTFLHDDFAKDFPEWHGVALLHDALDVLGEQNRVRLGLWQFRQLYLFAIVIAIVAFDDELPRGWGHRHCVLRIVSECTFIRFLQESTRW